ncbi:MAG: MbnP family protein, partial [Bacteroidota bacterium]
MKRVYQLIVISVLLTFFSCHKDDELKSEEDITNGSEEETGTINTGPSTVVLRFSNMMNGHDIDQSGGTMYATAAGQQFSLLKLKYYVSNVVLLKQDGTEFKTDIYHLVDESDILNTGYISINNVPVGNYYGVRFTIGVDSAKVASAQFSGDLDPSKGMFLSAADGFLSLLIEGGTNVSGVPVYSFHAGGCHSPNSSLKNITLSFNGLLLTVDGVHKPSKPHIYAGIKELFLNPVTIDF